MSYTDILAAIGVIITLIQGGLARLSLFEIPNYVLTQGLEGTADIRELHEIAEELNLLPCEEIEQ